MKKRLDFICPDCQGNKRVGTEICILCDGTGYFSDSDSQEEFTWKYDFSG